MQPIKKNKETGKKLLPQNEQKNGIYPAKKLAFGFQSLIETEVNIKQNNQLSTKEKDCAVLQKLLEPRYIIEQTGKRDKKRKRKIFKIELNRKKKEEEIFIILLFTSFFMYLNYFITSDFE